MVPRKSVQHAVPLVVAILAACSDSTGPEGEGRILGILQIEPEVVPYAATEVVVEGPIRWSVPPESYWTFPPEVIEAPRTAAVGEPFDVIAYTVGPNGCWSAAGLDVAESGRLIDLTPWDRHSGAEACTMIFGYLGHPTTLTLGEVGEWTIRVQGRRVRGDGSLDDSVTAERTVLVVEDYAADPQLEITLGIGEEINVNGLLGIAFAEVTEDSRCATDVVCVWEGNAAVVLGLTLGSGPSHPFALNTTLEPHSAEHGSHRVTLVEVLPAPVSSTPIPPASYQARLLIERVP
jgi:hypothetical protein